MKRRIDLNELIDNIINGYTIETSASFDNEKELREWYGDEIFEAIKEGTKNYLTECMRMSPYNDHIQEFGQPDFVIPLIDSVAEKSNGEIEIYDEFIDSYSEEVKE